MLTFFASRRINSAQSGYYEDLYNGYCNSDRCDDNSPSYCITYYYFSWKYCFVHTSCQPLGVDDIKGRRPNSAAKRDQNKHDNCTCRFRLILGRNRELRGVKDKPADYYQPDCCSPFNRSHHTITPIFLNWPHSLFLHTFFHSSSIILRYPTINTFTSFVIRLHNVNVNRRLIKGQVLRGAKVVALSQTPGSELC